MSAPALRFKQDDGKDFPEWEDKLLGSIVNFQNGKGHENIIDENGKYIVINSKFIASNGKSFKSAETALTPITKDTNVMVMSDVPNGKALGKCFFVSESNKYTLNQRICSLRSDESNNKFLFYLINRNSHFLSFDSGVGQTNLKKEDVLSCPLTIPKSKDEQIKIANFLTVVDEKITQLTQKNALLTQYKKGVMQQIFSQKLRFKDDDGKDFPEWADIKISELNLYISDGNYGEQYPTSAQMVSSGVPFIRANNIKEQKLVWDDMKFITPDHHKILTSGHLLPKDILITTRGEIGTVALVQDEFGGSNINAQICLLRVNDTNEVAPKFLLQELTTSHCQKQFKELQTGSALKQLPKSSLGKVSIKLPRVSEQTKIANFLTAIDDKITATQSQLQAVKQYKQGLLQQMFV